MGEIDADPHIGRVQRSVAMTLSHVQNPEANTGFGPWTSFHIAILIPDDSYLQNQPPGAEPIVYHCYEYYSHGFGDFSTHSRTVWSKIFHYWCPKNTLGFVVGNSISTPEPVAGSATGGGVVVVCSSSLSELDNDISSRILWWLSVPTVEDFQPDGEGGVEFVK